MAKAARALSRRDLSECELSERLERARVPPAARAETVERLAHAGAVDDERFARGRAELLAERDAGDLLIRHDLAGRGIAEELVDSSVAGLDPEPERAAKLVQARGTGLKTARYLMRKGFSEESIEMAVAEDAPPAVR